MIKEQWNVFEFHVVTQKKEIFGFVDQGYELFMIVFLLLLGCPVDGPSLKDILIDDA